MSGNKNKTKEKKKNNLGAPPEKRAVKDKVGSAIAKRTSARLAATQVIYQMRHNNQDAQSAVEEFIARRIGFELEGDTVVPADKDLLKEIVLGFAAREADVRTLVSAALAQGGKSEVEDLLEAILLAGVSEIISNSNTDVGIIINDYLNVTDSFYTGSETKIVNAVLDGIAKKVRE